MNANLEKFNQKTMSSREISELTGKRHDHVLRDCDVLNESYKKMSLPISGETHQINTEEYHRGDRTQYKYLKLDTFDKLNGAFDDKSKYPLIQQGSYIHPQNGQTYREYLLTRMQTFDLMTGYNVELRIKVNRRWEELETKSVKVISRKDLALMIIEQEEQIEQQQKQLHFIQQENQRIIAAKEEVEDLLQEAQPKLTYLNKVLDSKGTLLTNQIAKEFGMSDKILNAILRDLKVQYKQNGQWLLAAKYSNLGYTDTRTSSGETPEKSWTSISTVWTQKGRMFIHELITPMLQLGNITECRGVWYLEGKKVKISSKIRQANHQIYSSQIN